MKMEYENNNWIWDGVYCCLAPASLWSCEIAKAFRQAKALGDELVVGVVSDDEIIANKGPLVLPMEDRDLDQMLALFTLMRKRRYIDTANFTLHYGLCQIGVIDETKADYDKECKISTRRWRPGRDARYKKTETVIEREALLSK
ncbi:hypothetical protein REPUB_Repub12eG0055000 [Reevesia pubescens]